MEVQSDPGVRCCSEGISHQRGAVWVEVRATTNQVHPDFQSDGQSPAVFPTFRTGDGIACQGHDLDVQQAVHPTPGLPDRFEGFFTGTDIDVGPDRRGAVRQQQFKGLSSPVGDVFRGKHPG